ncbi:MerR family transcriptional regulator [soil metagenome]
MPFSIKDLENLTGIKAHTIRIWEQRYTFLKPQRTKTNIRHYSNEELKNFLNIALLNKHGYRISQIEKMSENQIRDTILSLPVIAGDDILINELIKAMTDVNIRYFEQKLDEYLGVQGTENAVLNIIYPFLERIGILWLTGNINPAQEHLVSNVIRQKIIVGIEHLPIPDEGNVKACLFLPNGEYHEMALLFVCYLMKKKGINVIYVGNSTPLKDIESICNVTKPQILYTHLTTAGRNFNFEFFLQELSIKFSSYEILISGKLTEVYSRKVPKQITLMYSLKEVLKYIADIK